MLEAVLSVGVSIGLYSLLFLVGFWIWFQWSRRELIKTAKNIPVLKPCLPLLGHLYLALFSGEDIMFYMANKVLDALEKGVRTFCVWIGPMPFIIINDAEDIHTLLNGAQSLDKSDEYDLFRVGLDPGTATGGAFTKSILSGGGTRWRVTRKHMNPMFHPRNVQQLEPVFNANSRELVERMSHHLGRGPFNVYKYNIDLTLKTICSLIYGPGFTFDVNSETFRGLSSFVQMMPELTLTRILQPWLGSEFMFKLIYRKTVKKMGCYWKNFTETPLKAAQEILKQKTPRENISYFNERNKSPSGAESERISFLELYAALQKSHPEFTDADLLWEILILYGSGTDTASAALSAYFLAVAQYQDIQDRLYQEITSVVGPDDDVTQEHLARMPYLEMVMKETLRRFNIVPFIVRKPTKDVTFKEFKMPAGYPVVCNLAGPHMDPKIYQNPRRFDPERFSPEKLSGKRKHDFVPFSAGPRICIGKHYSIQLLKTAVVHVLRKYKISTTQDVQNVKKMSYKLTLVFVEGYNITLECRNLT